MTAPGWSSASRVSSFFVWRLAHHEPVSWADVVLTFGGLSLGARRALAFLGLGGAALLGWLFLAAAAFGIGLSAVVGVYRGAFEPMTTPTSILFIRPPTASPGSTCTTEPAVWVLHVFHPGDCAGIAGSRLGLAALCVAVLALIRAANEAVTMRGKKN